MKQLLIAIIMLIPILCYAQDPQGVGRKLEDAYRRNNRSNNTERRVITNSLSNSTRKPSGKIQSKRDSRNPAQNPKNFQSEVGAFSKAHKSDNGVKEEEVLNAFRNADKNKGQATIGGKSAGQHAMSLMQGATPGDVKVNVPVEQRFAKKQVEVNKAEEWRKKCDKDYVAQFKKIRDVLEKEGYRMEDTQITQIISSRAKGENFNTNYPEPVADELKKAAAIYNVSKKADKELSDLRKDLGELQKECGGKCK